jgi:hypothetical protein
LSQSSVQSKQISFENRSAYFDDDNSSFYSEQEDPEDLDDAIVGEDLVEDSDSDDDTLQHSNAATRVANDSEFQRQLMQELLKFEQTMTLDSSCLSDCISTDRPLNEQKRNFCVNELLNSESSYVLNLNRIAIFFERPLRSSKLVSRSMLDATFLPLNRMYQLQLTFDRSLQSSRSSDTVGKSLGQVLCDFFENPQLSVVYTSFCSIQSKAVQYIEQQKTSKAELNSLLTSCEQRFAIDVAHIRSQAQPNSLPFHAHLLQPMQRITRYPMLLRDILTLTCNSHPDKALLQRALQKAETLCAQVNDCCRQLESKTRLKWMERHIQRNDLDYLLRFQSDTKLVGPRIVLQAGTLIKIRSGRKLMAFLCNDMLLLTVALSSVGRPIDLNQSDRALRAKYRLYRKPYMLHHLTIVSKSTGGQAPLDERVAQLNGFIVGVKSSGKMLLLQSPQINMTRKWANNLHEAIQVAKRACQKRLDQKHEEAPLLQDLDASSATGDQMTLTLLECNPVYSANLLLFMYCNVSLGFGRDPQGHQQTTRTGTIRQLPTPSESQSRLSWSGSEKSTSSVRVRHLFHKRSSLYQTLLGDTDDLTKVMRGHVKRNASLSDNRSTGRSSLASYSVTFNLTTLFLLPNHELEQQHLVITCFQQSPYSPDKQYGQLILPVLYLKQHSTPSSSVSFFEEPLDLKCPMSSGEQVPKIKFKVQFKSGNYP